MNCLILGSGGREHAFSVKIRQSNLCENLFIAPGNGGTAQVGTNVNLNPLDFPAVAEFCLQHQITLLIPGNEDPLVHGLVDYFKNRADLQGIKVAGPTQKGAMLEGSKDFAKAFMAKYQIPTAAYQTFTKDTLSAGHDFLKTLNPPYVLKADGLAAGKGVVIPPTYEEACAELTSMLADAKFGEASAKVVIEEFLSGIEVSVFVLTDGNSYCLLPEAKDYKRIGEGDTGLNTGGMGAISPVPFVDDAFLEKVKSRIVEPTIQGLKEEQIDYRGFIFLGLMNVNGDPYVIEYNVRMGDPETEAVLPRVENDLMDLLLAVCNGTLHEKELKISQKTAATVVLVSGGYPGDYPKGLPIQGLENQNANTHVFHAGTKQSGDQLLTNGGRVFAITALEGDIQSALNAAYLKAQEIAFEGKYFRRDIGLDLINLAKS